MTASLKGALARIGEPGADQKFPRIPGQLASSPGSLQALCRATVDPQPSKWHTTSEVWVDESWSEECQGVAYDGTHFYFSRNNSWKPWSDAQAIYRYQGGTAASVLVQLDDAYGAHIGDIDVHQGTIFAAMEQPSGILEVSVAGDVKRLVTLKRADGSAPPQSDLPWCAVNPWNGLLYSSPFSNVTRVFAYDPANGYRNVPDADIRLATPADRVQGGTFSPLGHLYLSCDTRIPSDPRYKAIQAYSALNGASYGTARVLAEEDDQEMEGICYAKGTWSGKPARIHVILLENRNLAADNIYFKHLTGPAPEDI